ncbi:hypothetical protein [Bartonella queenslandensis]|uniref:hypothetical protein n=1 Tax=Bartonella queenslandensis TaxID=481138 RepID=UPI001BA4B28D|nr:hypothetical protein [Bartonella queenslandensis]
MLDVFETAVLMSVCLHGKRGLVGGRYVRERGGDDERRGGCCLKELLFVERF